MPNPLLERRDYDDLPNDLKRAHDHSMKLRGDATFFEVFAQHPTLYRWYTDSFYAEVFRGGIVERRIKEIVRLRLSVTHGCRFCNQGNKLDALDAGLKQNDVDAIVESNTDHFSAKERAAICLADEIALTNSNGELTEANYADLKVHFSDAEILELGMTMGILTGMAKFLFAFDLVEKEPGCPLGKI